MTEGSSGQGLEKLSSQVEAKPINQIGHNKNPRISLRNMAKAASTLVQRFGFRKESSNASKISAEVNLRPVEAPVASSIKVEDESLPVAADLASPVVSNARTPTLVDLEQPNSTVDKLSNDDKNTVSIIREVETPHETETPMTPWQETERLINKYINASYKIPPPESLQTYLQQINEQRGAISGALSNPATYYDTYMLLGNLSIASVPPEIEGQNIISIVVKDNLPILEEAIRAGTKPSENKAKYTRDKDTFDYRDATAAFYLVGGISASYPDEAREFIDRNIQQVTINPVDPAPAFEVFGAVMNVGVDDGQKASIENILRQKLDEINSQNPSKYTNCLYRLTMATEDAKDLAQKIAAEKLESFGLDVDKLRNALSYSTKDTVGLEISNLSKIASLEQKLPGSARALQKEFGINYFYRYPEELLLDQARNKDKKDMPFGVVIGCYKDPNGSFNSPRELKSIHDQLQGKYQLRVFEAEGKLDIARSLLTCKKKYAPSEKDGLGHKISFAFLAGHGKPDGIAFGKERITISDLIRPTAQRTSEFFEKNPTIVLLSCTTGVKEGFAQKLQETIGGKIIAPDAETDHYADIKAIFANEGIDFDISYAGSEGPNTMIYGSKDELPKAALSKNKTIDNLHTRFDLVKKSFGF